MAKFNNSSLGSAKKAKNDEFYTQLRDIENEVYYYHKHFKDKVVFLNCDDPEWSNFWEYFRLQFDNLGLKKLIATHFDKEKPTYKLEMTGTNSIVKTDLMQNGDFRSDESIELLKEADIVCTNPPFSLFKEYIGQLIEYDKKFLVIGSMNAITYKEIFPLIKDNRVWLGCNSGAMAFRVPDDATGRSVYEDEEGTKWQKMGNIAWFTNLEHDRRNEELMLGYDLADMDYQKYDNYDAIEVSKVAEIPRDYFGVIGVPVSFLTKYCPQQFQILGMCENEDLYGMKTRVYTSEEKKQAYFAKFGRKGQYDLNASGVVIRNGKYEKVYQRILIKRKKVECYANTKDEDN